MKAPSTTPSQTMTRRNPSGDNHLRTRATVKQTDCPLFAWKRWTHEKDHAPTHEDMILLAMQGKGPLTAAEINDLACLQDRYEAHRRLPGMERQGLVRRGDMRICHVTHRVCQTWSLTHE